MLLLISAYLFELNPIKRLEIQFSKSNIPSRKVAEKSGFMYEALKRQAIFTKKDGFIYFISEGGEKFANILMNPNVSMAIYENYDRMDNLAGMQLWGADI